MPQVGTIWEKKKHHPSPPNLILGTLTNIFNNFQVGWKSILRKYKPVDNKYGKINEV